MRFNRNFFSHSVFAFLIGCVVAVSLQPATNTLYAEQITDDFSDGNWNDGTPIDWSILDGNSSSVSITADNALRLDSASGLIRIGVPSAPDTASLRIEGRLVSSFIGLSFPNNGHWVALDSGGLLMVGQNNDMVLDSFGTGLSPISEDVIIQMDWVGDTVSAWAWNATDPPDSETPHAQHLTSRSRAFPSVFTNSGAIAEFHSITISDQHLSVVPEPASLSLILLGVGVAVGMTRPRRPSHS